MVWPSTVGSRSWLAFWVLLVAVSTTLVAAGCDRKDASQSRSAPNIEEVDAQQLFIRKCAHCHGARGRGDGPGGRSYARVANLRSPEVQSRLSDDEIASIISDGKGQMPPVRGLHAVEVTAIVSFIRTMADEGHAP